MTKKPQIEKFRELAREKGADLSEEEFEAALRKLAKADPNPKDIQDLAAKLGQTEKKSE